MSSGRDVSVAVRLGARRVLGGLTLAGGVALTIASSCSPGELHLKTEPSETGGTSSGGEASDGGSESMGEGAAGPDDSMNIPNLASYTCVVRGDCPLPCDPDQEVCPPRCESSEECNPLFPHCDSSVDVCVECIDDDDCERRFGSAFPECSSGRCVQCQRDDDCDSHDCDHGWCQHCDDSRDCDEGTFCYETHCLPVLEFPTP
jgi:hypothetical protein